MPARLELLRRLAHSDLAPADWRGIVDATPAAMWKLIDGPKQDFLCFSITYRNMP